MNIEVRVHDLVSMEVQELITEHLAGMHGNSPPGHVNALALDGLRQPDITFWSAWCDKNLCGCGALRELNKTSGEIKSMRTHALFLRSGVGQAILNEIICTARTRGYKHLYLETGTGPSFTAAHSLYLRNGFNWCSAFSSYSATGFNAFMRKIL